MATLQLLVAASNKLVNFPGVEASAEFQKQAVDVLRL